MAGKNLNQQRHSRKIKWSNSDGGDLGVANSHINQDESFVIEFFHGMTSNDTGFATVAASKDELLLAGSTSSLVSSFTFSISGVNVSHGSGQFTLYYTDGDGKEKVYGVYTVSFSDDSKTWTVLDDTGAVVSTADSPLIPVEVLVPSGFKSLRIEGSDVNPNQGFQVNLSQTEVVVGPDLALDFDVIASNSVETEAKGTITLGIDQTGDSKVMIGTTLIDGIISGMRYETSSGFVGYTDANGALKYNLSDNVTFSVGSVVLGTVAASATMISGKVFLQDIVGVGLENITDDYVEKLAIFLQTLDNDGDAYNGIVITDEMHALFSDDNFDLEAITKEELVQLLLDNGLTPVDEDEAIQHVKDMITEHAGVTEFEEDDNDSISLLGDDEGLDLAWSLSDPEEPVDGMYLSDEADQVSLEIGDLLGDGIPDSDLSQYISVASDGLNTVIEVNSAGIGNTEGGASMSYTLEGVDLTTDTNGNALDTDSMNELLRNLYNGANDTGLM